MNLVTPDFGLIFWQTLTFVVVLLILKKFAWQKILDTIKSREESIKEALESAKKARLAIDQLKSNNEILIKEANLERDRILKDAMSIKKSIIDNARIEAEKVKDKTISDSKMIINREKDSAISFLKNYTVNFSLQIAEKLLKRELKSDKSQKDLINSLINNK
jgi:F-type H+-transporting ATPase subunit b